MAPHTQDEVQAHSLLDPENFWAQQATQLHWHKIPTKSLEHTTKILPNGTKHQHWAWFPGGEISTCYNCVDRHVVAGQGDRTAIIWDSPVTGSKEQYTYSQVLSEVETLAGVLREEGVKKGDVVLVYSMSVLRLLYHILCPSHLSFTLVQLTQN
jgi:propionyl-CoA synthetase